MKSRGFHIRRRRHGKRQHGVAMLAVITAVAICLVIVNEFGTSTTIDMMQSRNNLDQMRAHFLARSSLNITELIIRLQRRLDNAPGDMGHETRVRLHQPGFRGAEELRADARRKVSVTGGNKDVPSINAGRGADTPTGSTREVPLAAL